MPLRLSPLSVPFSDDAVRIIGLDWRESGDVNVQVGSKRAGQSCVVQFSEVVGIRILDELDLASWWVEAERACLASSWLFAVDANGWLAFEQTRQDFYTKHMPHETFEYLLAGFTDCVSILSSSSLRPAIQVMEAPLDA